uniref:Uncharacterized protein n=1 Tax=Tanacetum cinerariifolium TaxID=118510 RepID=A0A6L2J4M0_TANCI|nr:hypothetical protein [Tanacetum cinerariifolium]
MVTRAKAGIFKPLERMNCHVTTTSPLPRSHVYALHDLNWKEAMLDEYNALITSRTRVLVPRPANVNVRIISSLHSEFAMMDLGSLNYFLGIFAQRSTAGLLLSQSKFAQKILEQTHMQNCNPCQTLVDTKSKLGSDDNHRIFRYVRGTLDYGLQLYVSSTTQLSAYTDADWASFPVTRRSTSGYCVFLGDNLLSWFAKRQVILSRSSAEAEYQGVTNVVAETAWIYNLLCEVHTPLFTPTLVYCDNVSAVYMTSRVLHVPSRFQATVQLETMITTISQEYLLELTSEYGISEVLHPKLPGPKDRIVDFPKGKDVISAENTYSSAAVIIPNTHRTLIQKQPEALLCLVGLSRRYYLGDEVYHTFLYDDDQDIDLFSLIRAPNPTKVKTRSRPRAAHEVPMLTVTANRVIEIEDPVTTTDSSRVPSSIKRSPLDYAHEEPSQQLPRSEDQKATILEVPPPEYVPTIRFAPEAGQAERVAAMSPLVVKERQSTRRGKSLAAIELGMESTRPAPASQGAHVDVSDPDLLSFAGPQSGPSVDVTQSSKGAAAAKDLDSKNTSFASMVGSPESIYRPEWEADMKKAAENKSAELCKELENMRALFLDLQVEQRCAEIDACLDTLSIDFDEELYPHMLITIACRRWMIECGLCLAAMKCGESTELKQAFVDVVSKGIAKGMSEGLKHRVEHGKAKLDLEAIEAYDPKAEAKYITALHALKSLNRAKKKKKCRVVCRTHGVGFAHHARSDGVLVSVPTVAPQGLAILLVNAATQTKISDEASPQLLRSSSLPVIHG